MAEDSEYLFVEGSNWFVNWSKKEHLLALNWLNINVKAKLSLWLFFLIYLVAQGLSYGSQAP